MSDPLPHGFFADDYERVMAAIERSEARLADRLEDLAARVDRLDEAIRGNGTAGLKARMDSLDRQYQRAGAALWIAVAAILTAGWDAAKHVLGWH